MSAFGNLRKSRITYEAASNWVLAIISSEAEILLHPHYSQQATVFFSYHYFLQSIPRDQFVGFSGSDNYEFCVYIAVHQALLKSDIDIVRRELLALYQQSPTNMVGFKNLNQKIDELFTSPLTQRLKQIIGRYGAPFRVLKSLVDDHPDIAALLPNERAFMQAYDTQIAYEYAQVQQRLNRRLVKSIVFIFITKVLVGLCIEVPYDLLLHGMVIWLPLAVNLLFPPLYMASLAFTLQPPAAGDASNLH